MSSVLGVVWPMASETGEWPSVHWTISCKRIGARLGAAMRTRAREVSGPAGREGRFAIYYHFE